MRAETNWPIILLRLFGAAADMRRQNHVGQAAQWTGELRRPIRARREKHLLRPPASLPLFNDAPELVIDYEAAAEIDEAGSVFHLANFFFAE